MKRFLIIFVTALLWCLVTTNLWAAPPSTQARSVGFAGITSSAATASWINGNGVGRIVVISTSNDWTDEDAILTTGGPAYTDNAGNLTGAPQVGATGSYVIDITTGTLRTSTFANLAPNTTYYVKVYEYNTNGANRDYKNSTATQNPRSFTTLAGIAAPTWATNPLTVTQNTNTAVIDWNTVSGATGYLVNVSTASGGSFDANRLPVYTNLDVGTDTEWDLYLPIAGTYYVAIKAYSNSETSVYSAEQTIIISVSMPPKFLDGDSPTLTTLTGTNAGNFTVTLTFDQAMYTNNDTTGALTTADFAVYPPNSGPNAASKVVIQGITHTAGSNTVTLTLRFNDRVTTSEKFRIGPYDATSIYGEIIAPSTTGIPMNTALHATKGGQYSADITCPDASVLNVSLDPDVAFTTIGGAIGSSLTLDGHTLELKENTTYSENVTVNKAVTLTDQNANNAIITGTWTLGSASDVNLSSGGITISGLTFDLASVNNSIIVGNIYNGFVSIQGNTFNNIASSKNGISVQSNRGTGDLASLVIGTLTANTFSGTAGKAIYFNDDGTGTSGITSVSIQGNTFPISGVLSIDFENVNLTNYLPVISLGTNNTNTDGMSVTSKYVYSHPTLNTSSYLYPGIAVLGTTTTLQDGTAAEYHTVAAAISASNDDGSQSVFLGQGTYTEDIALNEAVSLVGKGANASTGTVLQGTVTAIGLGGTYSINMLYFDCPATLGLVVSALPIPGHLVVSYNNFQVGANEIGIDVTPTINNQLTISNNTFELNATTAIGINLPNNQITSFFAITTNIFAGSAAGTGVYVSTTNSTGDSDGTFDVIGNIFSANVGDAIVFEDAVNNANSLSGATINIRNGNNFNQAGYGIKINESGTYAGFIGTTLPNTIDLYGTAANTNFTSSDIYGAAWYDLTSADATAFLYPSIQSAETADLAATLHIGAGTYAENVTFSGGTNLTTITGYGTTCELATGQTATIEKDYTFSGFLAPSVIVGDDDINTTEGNIDDAVALVKNNGTIQIAADAVIGGGTISKSVTITDAGTGGAIDGTLIVNVSGVTVSNLDLSGNPAITIAPTTGITNPIAITGNTFTLTNGGNGLVVETGNATAAGTAALNVTGNTFTGGDATSAAIRFRNQTTGFANFSAVNVYDGNTFNTAGYDFYRVNENNLCTYLPSIDVKNTTDNIYTTPTTFGFYYNPTATTLTTNTESLITDCTAPAAFTTGSVTTTTNAVANWWNGDNSAVNINVPIANDPSLSYGTVQIIATRDNWTTTQNLGTAQTIVPGDLNSTKTYTYPKATFEALTGFTENDVWRFNAIITDFAGNSTTGTQSTTTLTVDRVDPTATLNSATADNIINIVEKAAGFNVNAQANENSTTLYVVNVTDNTPDYNNIGTVGFASANAPTAGNPVDIAISANNTNIIQGKTYRVFAMDLAGNLSAASVTAFTTDLTAPANFTVGNVIVVSGNKPGYYNADDNTNNRNLQVTVPVDNDNSLTGGTIQVQVKRGISGTFANIGTPYTILVADLNTNVNITITKAQLQAISGLAEGDILYWTAVITDFAGNPTTGTQSSSTIIYDITPPAATSIASRTSVTAPVVANYFNASNTAVDVVINIPNDQTLVGGNVKLQARTNANTFADVAVTTNAIAPGDLGSTKTIQVAKTGTGNTDLDELTGWASGVTLDFRAVLEDAAGNVTDGTTFSPSMTVDLVAPAAFTTGSVTTVTNAVAGYWNADNTQLNVVVPVANDATLAGGTIKLYASKDNFASDNQQLGSTYTIQNSDLDNTYTFNIPAATFEALTGFAEGNVWEFRAVITDIAGNSTTGTKSATSITVDQIAPTATLVSATADNVINIAEKAAGFNVVAQSNEATQTLYVVDVTTNPTVTYSNIGTVGFATAVVAGANTNTNVPVSANNTNIITGSTYKVYTMDAAGNLSAASTGSFTTDLVAPTITSITSTTADGLYGIGANINFTLNLDEAAVFTANGGQAALDMALTTGTTDAIRTTNNASSTTLELTYTVANGDSKIDLTWTDGAVVLSGGATWTDAAGNPVTLTTPVGGSAAFAAARAIDVDGVPPTFTVAYHLNSVTGPALGVNPTIGIGSNYYIKITANEELVGAPTISISGLDNVTSPNNNVSNASTLVHVANTVFSYNRIVYQTEDNGVDENITISGTDLAGNTATAAVPTNAIPTASPASTGYQAKVDGKRPQPVITLAAPVDYNDGTNDWTNNNPIAASINYYEAVQNVTNSVISVTNGTKSNFVNTSNTVFTVDVTPSPTTQGTTVTVSVPEGNVSNQIKDAGGNFAYGATKSIKYDGTAPTTTDNVPATWQNTDITITFSPNDGAGSGTSKVYYTTDGSNPTISSSFVTSPYQITITTDGQYTIKYRAEDNVGNLENTVTATNQAKLDKTAPSILANTITAPTNTSKWNGGNHNITWTASNITDATSGLATNPISLYYSTNASDPSPTWTLIASALANSGSYTWNVPNDINSTDVKVRINAVDNAGNVASQLSQTFTIDNIPPTATITISPNNAPLPNGYSINNATASVTIDADFSEAMDQTLAPTLALNTELDNILNDEVPTAAAWQSATKYRWVLAINGNGLVKLDNTIDVTGAKDLAQNTMTPAQLANVKVDQVAPTITFRNAYQSPVFNTNTTDKYAKAGENVFFEFTANELLPTNYLEGSCGIASFSGEGGTNYSQQDVSGTQVYFIYKGGAQLLTTPDGELTYNVRFADEAGNCSNQLIGNSGVIFDKTLPVIAFTSPIANTCVKVTDVIGYSLTETNRNLDAAGTEVRINGGSWMRQDDDNDNDFTFYDMGTQFTELPDGSFTMEIRNIDLAGNISSTASRSFVKDETAPSISSITLGNVTLGDNTAKITTDNSVTFTVTFSEPVYNFTSDDITLYKPTGTVNNPDIVITGGNTIYTVTLGGVTPITGDGPLGITVSISDIVDCASNALTSGMTSATFTIDNTPPTVSNVESNCHNSPIAGYTFNQAARVTFSEGVYTNSNASGALVAGDLNISASGGNATLQSWNVINGSHTAGGTNINITTSWNGTILGSEQLRADAFNATSIYDQAGNAMAVAGANQGGPNPPKNWDYAKVQIAILTQPSNQSTCETGSAQFTTSAQGGLSVAYQWQYYDGTNWVNLTNGIINGATFSNVTTSQVTITNPPYNNWNGVQFRCNVTNDCGSQPTDIVTLTVNLNVAIQTQPSNQQACFGSVDATFSVVATGTGPYTYQWEVYDGSNWVNAANGTPANATYTGATTANLNVTGNIALGTYQYRVVVGGGCGAPVTSNTATLTVNSVPSAGLTVQAQNATVCTGSGTNIQVVNSQSGISYQLRIGLAPINPPVTGNGSTINLPTGNLTSTTTFNVLATNANCSIQLTQTATVTVEDTPVNPTLSAATPTSGTTVCQGSTVSATFNAGSGGSADEFRYSLDNGSNWSTYNPGDNLTAGTQTVFIQGRRNAVVCTPGAWTTLATWNVELTPVAASLTKDPNTAAVCAGTSVRAIWPNHGSGGNGTYAYHYRTSTDNGTNWTSWTTYNYTQDGNYYGEGINTTGLTNVEIRATRNADVCTPATNTVSWTVNPLPSATISGTTPACQSTVLTATTNASNPSYQWKLNGNNVGTNQNTYTATASGNYTVVVTDGITGCSNTSSNYAVQIDAMPTVYTVSGGPFCAGSNISINLSGSQAGYTYNVKLGPSTVTSETGTGNPMSIPVNSAAAGTYTVEAVNGTCTQSMSGSVLVNPAPTANAGADAYTCGTTSYTVNDATATNYASISWGHNGLGSISNGNTLTPTYTPVAGDIGNTVTLTLTVTALSGCSNTSDFMLLQVRAVPDANISASGPLTFCQGGSVTLTAAENGATYQWRESGNPIIGETSQTLFVNTSGNYTVTVTKNGCSQTTSSPTVVTVNPNPSITTDATNQTRCGTGNVTFTAATTSPNSVIDWSSTNNFASYTTGNSHTVSVTAGNTDTYYYRARNTVTGCVSVTQSVTGTAYVLPTPTISGNNSVTVNTDLILTSTNSYSAYQWTATGSPTITNGTSQTATFNWSNAGSYVVTLTVTDANSCQNSTTHNVTVSATQAPVITGNPSNTTKCSNETATFSVTSVSGVPTPTLQWQVSVDGGSNWTAVSGGDYTGANTIELTVSNLSGKNGYQYRLFATNGVNPDAYSNAATLTVTTAQTPSVSIASDDPDNTFCSGTNVTFTATPSNTGGGTVSYQWKLNGGNVGANQNTYSNNALANNDQVQCVITITGGCVTTNTANSNTITNTVHANTSISQHPQNATVNEGDNHTFTVTATGHNLSYTWYKVGTPDVQVGTNSSSYTISNIQNSDAGTYYVVVSGTCGNVQSNNATLTVQQPAVKLAIDNIGTQTDGTQFTITVRSLNSSNVPTNVNQNTEFTISVETGTGTIGTVTGTINNGSSSTTVNVTYNKTGGETGVSLKATRTSGMNLTAGISNTFTVLAAQPNQHTSLVRTTNWGSDYIEVTWTKSSPGLGSLLLAKQSIASNLTETPSDGSTYSSNLNFSSAPSLGGAKIVYVGTSNNTAWISGLQPGTTYAFAVFAYDGSGSMTNYNTSVTTNVNRRQLSTSAKQSMYEFEVQFGEKLLLTGITPNPATSDVNFTVVTKEAMDANIEIVNELGVVVHSFSKSLTIGEHPFSLKLGTEKGGLPSGTYLLRVTAGGESLIQKFIYMP